MNKPVNLNNVSSIEELTADSDKRIGQVFGTMLIFTAMMVIAPISTYFVSKSYLFEGYLSYTKDESYIYSAISAVLVIHVILGAYIYIAWKDANSDAIKKKIS